MLFHTDRKIKNKINYLALTGKEHLYEHTRERAFEIKINKMWNMEAKVK